MDPRQTARLNALLEAIEETRRRREMPASETQLALTLALANLIGNHAATEADCHKLVAHAQRQLAEMAQWCRQAWAGSRH